MDRLGMCMDELRVLARSNDPDRAASGSIIKLLLMSAHAKKRASARNQSPMMRARCSRSLGQVLGKQ
jgi:hypothetical protein